VVRDPKRVIRRNEVKQSIFFLDQKQMPTHWYNILPDLPKPLPAVLHPGTGKPVTPDDLSRLFPMAVIMQEFSPERFIEIPDEVQDIYRTWRPTPLHRAYNLEKALGTPARIFYKYEGVSGAGSHKPNTAVAQAYYNKKEGVKRIATETGAGQWGSALAMACSLFGIECKVYMVKVSYNQKPYRRILMEAYGAKCVPSPSTDTKAGRDALAKDPNSTGSLGLAISEAVEDAVTHENTHYSLGSVLNHVLLHQTIVGQESMKQMEMAGYYPDIVIACVGGGSNFGGMTLPFVREKITQNKKTRIVAVEPQACPHITGGTYAYDFGDVAGLTPLMKMHTLGHNFMPAPVHAGGLRYHGMSPIVSHLYELGLIEAKAVFQIPVFEAGVLFARSEGILPAPESAHAIRVAVDEAIACKESGETKTILFNLSGHGNFDLTSYEEYLSGKLADYAYPTEKIKESLKSLPKVSV
jgi:tryptophan synthase beta chain